jgi:transcriptional regulator with GAF, ATPase, and Fis domain
LATSTAAAAPPLPEHSDVQPSRQLEAVERDHILTILRETHWVITGPRGAAQVLGLNPSTLRSRIKKLGIVRAETTR